MSGEFIVRTQLGAVDHHALEIFVFSLLMLFATISIKTIRNVLWYIPVMSICCILLLIMLYKATWGGWLLVPFIICAFALLLTLIKLPKWEQKVLSIAILLVSGVLLYVLIPETQNYFNRVTLFWNWDTLNVTGEEMPLLFSQGKFDIDGIWGNFGVTFFIFLIGLGIFIYRYIKYRQSLDLFFIVWTITLTLITFTMRRFAYYLAINVSILTGYVCFLIYEYARVKIATTDKNRKSKLVMIAVWLVLLIGFPIARTSSMVVTDTRNMPTIGWVNTLEQLEKKSDNEAYIKGHKNNSSVLSWWDYGYWIVREGHIPVVCSPGGGNRYLSARVLASMDDKDAKYWLNDVKAKYIIVDDLMVTKKRYAILREARANEGLLLMDRLYANNVDWCKLVYQSNEVKVFEVLN